MWEQEEDGDAYVFNIMGGQVKKAIAEEKREISRKRYREARDVTKKKEMKMKRRK